MMKNAFNFILKALFVLKIFKILSWFFGHEEITAWLENKINFEIDDIKAWFANNYNHVLLHIS